MPLPSAVVATIIATVISSSITLFPHVKKGRSRVGKLRRNRDKLFQEAWRIHEKICYLECEIHNFIAQQAEKQIFKKTNDDWKQWCTDVNDIIIEANELDAIYQKARRLWYVMCAFQSRAELSKEMESKAKQIVELREKMNLEKALMDGEPMPFMNQPSEKKDILPLPWLHKNVETILELLKEPPDVQKEPPDLQKFGLYGDPGIGKTTIMRTLENEVKKSGLFNDVIFLTVEEEDNEKRILESIQKHLNSSPNAQKKKEEKKFLLILDQVQKKIDLKEFAILEGNWTVVVATRYRHLCEQMELQNRLQPTKMSPSDSQLLFWHFAGINANHSQNRGVYKQIVKECGDNPQVIKAMATRLKRENQIQKYLLKIQSSKHRYIRDGDDMFNLWRILFEKLNDSMKKCYLYAALYQQEEICEDHLVECWRAELFIPQAAGSDNSQIFRRARDDGHNTVKRLIDAELLVKSTRVKYVTMPLTFRNFALHTNEGNFSLVELERQLQPNSAARRPRQAKWVSLKEMNLKPIIEGANFEVISTLFLQRSNDRLENILNSCFVSNSQLRVLDLGYTTITSLPRSISKLKCLKALYLNNCKGLDRLPPKIGKLKNLEVLDICESGIHTLLDEIADLAGLRCLRASLNGTDNQSEVQQSNIITRLSLLEELVIVINEIYQIQWHVDVGRILEQVASLQFLTTLCFYFPSIKCFAEFIGTSVSWNNKNTPWRDKTFRSFKLLVGSSGKHHEIDMSVCEIERHFKVFAGLESPSHEEASAADLQESSTAISEVLKQACSFELIGHNTIHHLSSFGIDNVKELKACVIKDCKEMRSVISNLDTNSTLLPLLNQLHLINLSNLSCIFEGVVARGSLGNLTILTINNCHNLKAVLSMEMTQTISHLKRLRVENCSATTVIIGGGGMEGEITAVLEQNVVLPCLESLELINLPELHSICTSTSLEWHNSLQTIKVDRCSKLDPEVRRKLIDPVFISQAEVNLEESSHTGIDNSGEEKEDSLHRRIEKGKFKAIQGESSKQGMYSHKGLATLEEPPRQAPEIAPPITIPKTVTEFPGSDVAEERQSKDIDKDDVRFLNVESTPSDPYINLAAYEDPFIISELESSEYEESNDDNTSTQQSPTKTVSLKRKVLGNSREAIFNVISSLRKGEAALHHPNLLKETRDHLSNLVVLSDIEHMDIAPHKNALLKLKYAFDHVVLKFSKAASVLAEASGV